MKRWFLYVFLFLMFAGIAVADYHPPKTLFHWGGQGWQHGAKRGQPSFDLVLNLNDENEKLMIVTDSDVCNSYNCKAECSRLRLVDSRGQEVVLDHSHPIELNLQSPRGWPVTREQLQGLKGAGKSIMEGRFLSSTNSQELTTIFESDVDFDELNRALDDGSSAKL